MSLQCPQGMKTVLEVMKYGRAHSSLAMCVLWCVLQAYVFHSEQLNALAKPTPLLPPLPPPLLHHFDAPAQLKERECNVSGTVAFFKGWEICSLS